MTSLVQRYSSSIDIFQLLLEDSKKKEGEERDKLLESISVKQFFVEGNLEIDLKTCKGAECKLCIEACPTNALYWRSGEVGIVKELCIYCTACVWSCIVDDCIRIKRKRLNGEVEEFSNTKEVLSLLHRINAEKRGKRVTTLMKWTRKSAPLRKVRRRQGF